MIKDMYKVQRFGKEWHVDVYETAEIETLRVKIYVLGRNDGSGPRSFKMLRKAHNGLAHIPLPKKFANAMLAWVTMRGET